METDASTGYGMGGIERKDNGATYAVPYEKIQGWPQCNEPDIVYLELAAVYIMLKLRAKTYNQKAILIRCDNSGVCAILTKKSRV